jgi:hypothetical protein
MFAALQTIGRYLQGQGDTTELVQIPSGALFESSSTAKNAKKLL